MLRTEHQHQQQGGAGSKFQPYAKRGIPLGYCRDWLSWIVWLARNERVAKLGHATFGNEDKILDLVGEMQVIDRKRNDQPERRRKLDRIRTRRKKRKRRRPYIRH